MLKYKRQKANKYLDEDNKQVMPDLIATKQMVQQIGNSMAHCINNIQSTVIITRTKDLVGSVGRINYL